METPVGFATIRPARGHSHGSASVGATGTSALRQADRLAGAGRLATSLAREVSGPTSSIAGRVEEMLELLRQPRPSSSQLDAVRECLLALWRQALRCDRLAGSIMAYARAERASRESGDVEQVVDRVVEMLAPDAREKGVILDRRSEPAPPPVAIDLAGLEQLLVDLVQNGIDACGEGDHVLIAVRADGRRLRITVEDTGGGIPAEVMPRIFEPFFTTKAGGSGTGLGLSACQQVAEALGGSIQVASAPGCGTVVTALIPNEAHPDADKTRPARPVSEDAPAHVAGRRWSKAVLRSFRSRPYVPSALLAIGAALLCASGCGQVAVEAGDGHTTIVGASAPGQTQAETPAPSGHVAEAMTSAQLYGHYCASCHGDNGDGSGPAARFLYPKPRNFREAQFRLVTTDNRVPSDSDLAKVIDRGMPGSAMFPFAHLAAAEKNALVAHVRQLVRAGVEERLRRQAKESGDEIDAEELASAIKTATEPGAVIDIPRDLASPSEESVGRGRVLYVKNCASCHGDTGKGDGVQEQKDESGMPIRPRDFTRGFFKGGREREQLYARVLLGAPGTPMPATGFLKSGEVGDLINFVLSLSRDSDPAKVEHRRKRLVARRVSETLSDEIPGTIWDTSKPVAVVISPLWWRNYEEPALTVQALHDQRTLAVRLSWKDASRDGSAVRPQDFPDMAAVQLFRGGREPFLGMGSASGPVDVWLWNAAAQADGDGYGDVDTTYPNMVVDSYPFEANGLGAGGHPTARQPREFLSGWAAGNPRSDPTHPLVGSNLHAKGFGSLTMRLRVSQVVQASGRWKDGRWTVVLRRTLHVAPEAGLSLAAGDRGSIAIAIWDGAARDRNGQKLVSIWHDLELE